MNHSAAQANYDKLSRWYDWFSASEKHFTRAGLELLDPKAGQRLLEIGCGTGYALCWLAGRNVNATGVDLSAGMLSKARHLLIRLGCQQVDLCQGDALSLPYAAQTFHAVFLSFTLELFPEPEIALLLGEIRRTLRHEGHLGIVALRRENTLAVRTYDWFHRHWPNVVDCRPILLEPLLSQAGYTIRATRRERMWGLPVEILNAVRP